MGIDMPPNKNFKRLVRARMAKTGESYTAARAQLVSRYRRLQSGDMANERAEVELRRAFELLRDAIDSARAAGLSWADVARRLRTDPRTVEGWFREP